MDDKITAAPNHGKVKEISISQEMRTSFLNYAMSVIVSRALPDVRDGLKPVQRRILYAMNDLGMHSDKAFKKSARIVGEVIGKYHPHGDSSVYEAMVRMAQEFSYRTPLIEGHGNFGSVDGDPAAAMRYTEARMSKAAMEMLRDIDKNTVNFIDNYDSSETEPSVLPARFPNLLVNGSTGIAVGMATNIPPHNLGEVINGVLALTENPEISTEELMEHITGPDFPTGGQILGLTGLRQAYETGNGSIVVRAKADIIENHGRNTIIVTEIPYQVNKSRLIDKIAEIAKEKIVEGITDLRDESNRNGMRIVIDLRRDVNPHVMLNNLYKYTQLQTSFGINMIALVDGQPKTITLKSALEFYFRHQIEIITRRTAHELGKAEERLHILQGLLIALENIDDVIALIKKSDTTDLAKEALMNGFELSDTQAKAILDMRLQRLTGLEIEKIRDEEDDLESKVADYKDILAREERQSEIVREELSIIRDKYANDRCTEVNLHEDLSIENEDLIPVEDVIITVTKNGYVKRMKTEQYKTQHRGGTGMSGIKIHDDDYVEHIMMTSTHDYLLFFTNKGRVYKMKGYQIPFGSRQSRGLPIVNLLNFESDETLASFTNIQNFDDEQTNLLFATTKGIVKRTPVSAYKNIRTTGIIAISLREDDELLSVKKTDGERDIILGASNGKAIRFRETDVRAMGRTASGVKGMNIGANDHVVGMAVIEEDTSDILVVTEKGFGKRSKTDEYRLQTRGGKGVKALSVTEKNGCLTTLRSVSDDQDLIITTDRGIVIRMHIDQISLTRRATQGVRLIRLRETQKVSTIALVPRDEEADLIPIEDSEAYIQESIALEEKAKPNVIMDIEPDIDQDSDIEKSSKKDLFDIDEE